MTEPILVDLTLRNIEDIIKRLFKARCAREGLEMKAVIVGWLSQWLEDDLKAADRWPYEPPQDGRKRTQKEVSK